MAELERLCISRIFPKFFHGPHSHPWGVRQRDKLQSDANVNSNVFNSY